MEDFLRHKIDRAYDEAVKVGRPLSDEAILNLFYVTSDQIRLLDGRLTTDPATKVNLWDALAQESTTPPTPGSSPSGRGDTPNGRVAPSLECVHEWLDSSNYLVTQSLVPWGWQTPSEGKTPTTQAWCRQCGALILYGKMHVPGVETTPST